MLEKLLRRIADLEEWGLEEDNQDPLQLQCIIDFLNFVQQTKTFPDSLVSTYEGGLRAEFKFENGKISYGFDIDRTSFVLKFRGVYSSGELFDCWDAIEHYFEISQ